MTIRLLLVSGDIITIEDANSLMQFNRRVFTKDSPPKTVKVPVQISVLCDPREMRDRNWDYDDILKAEILFTPSEHRHLVEDKYKYPYEQK